MSENKEVGLEVGDRIVELATDEEGAVTRLCPDKSIVYIRRDISSQQEMVEVAGLKRLRRIRREYRSEDNDNRG